MSFQKVFERLSEVKETAGIALEVGPSDARGGEVPSITDCTISWKPALEFSLWDESEDDEIHVLSIGTPYEYDEDDDEEVEYNTNVMVGIQALRKFPAKVLLVEGQRIWSAVT